MRITISKGTHNYLNQFQNSPLNLQIQNKKQQLSQNLKEKESNVQKDSMKGQYAENDFCCERWLASTCFDKDKAKRIELQNEIQFMKPSPKTKKNQQRTTQGQQKLTVVSNRSQQKLKFNFPRALKVMCNSGRRQTKILDLQWSQKIGQNQQSKKNSQLPLTPQISILSSIGKNQIGNKRLSMIQSCEYDKNSSTTRKLNLTMLRKSRPIAFNNNEIGEKSEQERLSPQKKEAQSIIYDKKQTTIQQSSHFLTDKNRSPSESEFKIVDPFDEVNSFNTEYLKQKIAFSSVESEREQFHHISQSIFLNSNNLPNPFLKKQAKHTTGGKELFQQTSLENQPSLSSALNSQESVVLEKNLQKMFKFSLPSFSKIPTSDQTPFVYTSTIMTSGEYQKSLE